MNKLENKTSGYYRVECDKIADFYDQVVRFLTFFCGGERRVREIEVQSVDPKPGERILDVCCGTGSLTILLKDRIGAGGEVIGIDLAPRMLNKVKGKSSEASPFLVQANAEALPFASDYFDKVVISLALHEMPQEAVKNTLREIYKVLRPGGRLICIDLNLPQSRRTLFFFKLFMFLVESQTAWDMLKRGLVNDIEEAKFFILRRKAVGNDCLQVIIAEKIEGDRS